MQQNFHQASKLGNRYDMRQIFQETLVVAMPDKEATVVSNHDTQPLQSLEAPVESWFKTIAYELILLRDTGYPCVFYPDLYGANYKDESHDGNEHEIWLAQVDGLESLLRARSLQGYGVQRDYIGHPNCIDWTREGNDEHSGCAVLLSNGENGDKNMEIGKRYAGKRFIDMVGEIPVKWR